MNDFMAESAIAAEDAAKAATQTPNNMMDFEQIGDARYYFNLEQGTPEWHKLRLGMLTASTMNKVLSPTLKIANNAETRKGIFDLTAQRITQHVEEGFYGWDMQRGHLEEVDARVKYEQEHARVRECGFVINETLGFPLGFSPDGLVGDIGGIEAKSRVAKYQVQTILEHVNVADAKTPIPSEFMLQVQSALFITGREWWDFLSYSNGLNMLVIRCQPIEEYQAAIKSAAIATEAKITEQLAQYNAACASDKAKIYPVARTDYSEELSA